MNVEYKKQKCEDGEGIERDVCFFKVCFFDESELDSLIDKEISKIIGKSKKYDLSLAKTRVNNYLNSLSEKARSGAIAEFFTHLFLRTKHVQASSFLNLEGKEIKKGFDGLYKGPNNYWLMESKSSVDRSVQHHSKIQEALNDLNNKVSGRGERPNNPWENAVNHIASFESLGYFSKKSLKEKIQKLSDDFENGIFHSASNFNLIPASTLFFETGKSFDDLIQATKPIIKNYFYKNLVVVFFENKIKDAFLKYLQE